jgi:hypothetical protein
MIKSAQEVKKNKKAHQITGANSGSCYAAILMAQFQTLGIKK